MRWLFLLGSILSALLTAGFVWLVIFYFQNYSPSWRVLALFSVVAFWALLSKKTFLRFRRLK